MNIEQILATLYTEMVRKAKIAEASRVFSAQLDAFAAAERMKIACTIAETITNERKRIGLMRRDAIQQSDVYRSLILYRIQDHP